MKNEIKSMKNWLKKENLPVKEISLTYPNGNKEALLVDTDYEGPYPGEEQFRILDLIRNHVSRYYKESLIVESRGHRTAVLISER